MILIELIRKIRKKQDQKLLKAYSDIPSSAVNRGIKLRLDVPENRNYLKIGERSIVAGNFIFESKDGLITIGNDCFIGGSTFISHSSITIGDHVTIAWGSTVYDHDSHSLDYLDRRKDIEDEYRDITNGKNFIAHKDWSNVRTAPIVIDDDAWIGMNCIILKGVHIGRGAVVGGGSIVTHDVPAWTVVAGNPAKIVKKLRNDEKL
jgi:acetyltransferase-like isoleucine patch superfamily enzyme